MLDILIYLLDDQYEEEIINALKGRDLIYHRANRNDEVVDQCRQDFIDLILVWPADSEKLADLFTVLNMHDLGHIPVIPVVHKNEDLLPILKLPVADVITIPAIKQEFFAVLQQMIRNMESKPETRKGQHWRGNLDEFSLIDLIQMVETSHKDAILTVSYRDHLGQVFFRHGKVIRATLRNLDSLPALIKMTSLHHGDFHVHFTRVDLADSLEENNQTLLVQLMQQIAEQEKYYKAIPDLYDDLITLRRPSKEKESAGELKLQILDRCEEGQSVHELMISMNEDNLELLQHIQELISDGNLVRRQDYEVIMREESENQGINKLLNSISGLFKKEKKVEEKIEIPPYQEKPFEIIEPELIHQTVALPTGTIQKIQKFFEEN